MIEAALRDVFASNRERTAIPRVGGDAVEGFDWTRPGDMVVAAAGG